MKYAIIISWVVLLAYLSTNIVVGSYPVDKEVYEGKNIAEIKAIQEQRDKSILYKAQKSLLPVWYYNRYIYSSLIMLCLVLSFIYFRRKAHNKSFGSDALKRAGQL